MNSTSAPQSAVHHVTSISELLSLIFAFSLPDERRKLKRYPEGWSLDVNSHFQYPSISEKETPLSLAHDSRPWRSVAFATPKLWACLHLHMDRQYDSNVLWTKRRLDALLFWLKQSRSLPLSVRISRSNRFGRRSLPLYGQCSDEESDAIDKDIIHLTKMMDALVEHTWRWENISIDLPETVTSPLNNYTNHEFPYLKTVRIKAFDWGISIAENGRLSPLSAQFGKPCDIWLAAHRTTPQLTTRKLCEHDDVCR